MDTSLVYSMRHMSSIHNAIRDFWRKHALGPGRCAVGYSGGGDSTALLLGLADLREELNLTVIVAHLHHGQRGERADEDEQHCRTVAQGIGTEIAVEKTDVPSLAAERHVGLEEAGRLARYEFFQRLLDKGVADWIATGHTLDDHVETVLMNLARGAGPRGLSGIPERRGQILRPILTVTRSATASYCVGRALPTITDSTNEDPRYTRNNLRCALSAIARPDLFQSIARSAEIVQAEDEFLDGLASRLLDSMKGTRPWDVLGATLSIAANQRALRATPVAMQRRIVRLMVRRLAATSVDFEHVEAIRSFESGSIDLPNGYGLEADGTFVTLVRRVSVAPWSRSIAECETVILPALDTELSYVEADPPQNPGEFTGARAVFDRESLRGGLTLHSLSHEAYRPYGFDGTRSVRDQLSSAGVPEWLRPLVPVVSDEEGPIWALGARIADRVRVTSGTRHSGYLSVRRTEPTV